MESLTTAVVFVLLAFSFVTQLVMFCIICELKDELKNVKDKLQEKDDYLDAYSEQILAKKIQDMAVSSISRSRRPVRSITCPNIAHFFLKGRGKEDYGANRFLWQPDGLIGTHLFRAVKNSLSDPDAVSAIQIEDGGVYNIFVQIKIKGRNEHNPPHASVGFSLKKNDDVLTHAVITQDDKGVRYSGTGNHRPVDTVSLSGVFLLRREDRLTVVPLDALTNNHHINYMNSNVSSHFGGFLLERSG